MWYSNSNTGLFFDIELTFQKFPFDKSVEIYLATDGFSATQRIIGFFFLGGDLGFCSAYILKIENSCPIWISYKH